MARKDLDLIQALTDPTASTGDIVSGLGANMAALAIEKPSRPTLPPTTEAQFTTQVIALAHLMGWLVAHFRPARTTHGWRTPVQGDKGFPDLVLVRRGVLLVAELKCGRNKPTAEQTAWLDAFRGCGIVAVVWTPDDWPEIERALMAGAG